MQRARSARTSTGRAARRTLRHRFAGLLAAGEATIDGPRSPRPSAASSGPPAPSASHRRRTARSGCRAGEHRVVVWRLGIDPELQHAARRVEGAGHHAVASELAQGDELNAGLADGTLQPGYASLRPKINGPGDRRAGGPELGWIASASSSLSTRPAQRWRGRQRAGSGRRPVSARRKPASNSRGSSGRGQYS